MSSQETSRPVGVVQAKVQFTIGLELFFLQYLLYLLSNFKTDILYNKSAIPNS